MSGPRSGRLAPAVALSLAFAWPFVAPAAMHQEGERSPRLPCWHLGVDVRVGEGETLDCSLVVVGGDVEVARTGTVAGDLSVPFGRADVEGSVEGSAFASGGLRLGETAVVAGDASSLGEVEIAQGARVGGRSGRLAGQPRVAPASALDAASLVSTFAFLAVLGFLAAASAALATVALPTLAARAGDAVDSLPRIAGTLLLGIAAGAILAYLTLITLPTIYLPLVIVFAATCAFVAGSTAIATRLGARILRDARAAVQAALGAAILVLLTFGPLLLGRLAPFVAGVAFDLLLASLALGAGLVGLYFAWQTANGPAHGDEVPAATVGHPNAAALDASLVAAAEGVAANADIAAVPEPAERRARPEPRKLGDVRDFAFDGPGEVPDGEPVGLAEALEIEGDRPDVASDLEHIGHVEAPEPDRDRPTVAPDARPPREAEWPEGAAHLIDRPAEEPPVPSRPHAAAPVPATAEPPRSVRDLAGMTPIYAHLLARAGLASLPELAVADPAAVVRVLAVPGVRPVDLATATEWVRLADAVGRGAR